MKSYLELVSPNKATDAPFHREATYCVIYFKDGSSEIWRNRPEDKLPEQAFTDGWLPDYLDEDYYWALNHAEKCVYYMRFEDLPADIVFRISPANKAEREFEERFKRAEKKIIEPKQNPFQLLAKTLLNLY
jgi:hypothetical protein